MRAIQERGQEEMQEALQLAASLMITHVTLNDVGTYYIGNGAGILRLTVCSHQKQSPLTKSSRRPFLFFHRSGLQTPWQQKATLRVRQE